MKAAKLKPKVSKRREQGRGASRKAAPASASAYFIPQAQADRLARDNLASHCSACKVKDEWLEHLRQQLLEEKNKNSQLLDRFLAYAPDAAAQYQKLLATHMMGNDSNLEGISPLSGLVPDNLSKEDQYLDDFMKPFQGIPNTR